MNSFLNILLITFIYLPIALSILKEKDIRVIVDVLQSFNKPSNIITNVCWNSTVKKSLAVSLAESINPRSIKFVNELNDKDLINKETIIFLTDVSCKGVAGFLNEAQSKKYYGRPYRWFVINRLDAEANIPPEIDEMDIYPDSEVYVFQFQNNNIFDINLIYKIKRHRDWIIEKYGTWSIKGGLIVSSNVMELVIAMRRRNLARETIVTSMVIENNNSLDDMELLRYKEIDSVSKLGYHHLTALYEFTNATRELLLTNTWGYFINGSWTGILGHISQEKAELPGSIMFITEQRMELVDYLSYPTKSSAKFLFREPPLSYQNNLYLLPFKASVWYCFGSFVVVLIGVMYVNAYWEARKARFNEDANDTTVLVPNLGDVTVFVMSAISQQGSNVELKSTLGRFVIFILFLVFLFLYTAYSASIVVLLQSSSNQIRTLADLLNSKLELGVEDTPYNRYWFTNEKDPIKKAIYEKKVAPSGSKPKYFELVEGVLQLQKKPFAFHCNLGTAYKVMEKYFYEHEKCGLQEISYIQDNNPWQACRRGSPYREIFKLGLLRNEEHGLNDRTNRILLSKKPVCSIRGGSFVSVSLVDCYPILLLLLYGMILGVVLLLAEVLYHRKMSASNV